MREQDNPIPETEPRCFIHKRFAETYINGKWWCSQCMDEIIQPDGWYVYKTPWGEYMLAGQTVDDWELVSENRLMFADARALQMSLTANSEHGG